MIVRVKVKVHVDACIPEFVAGKAIAPLAPCRKILVAKGDSRLAVG